MTPKRRRFAQGWETGPVSGRIGLVEGTRVCCSPAEGELAADAGVSSVSAGPPGPAGDAAANAGGRAPSKRRRWGTWLTTATSKRQPAACRKCRAYTIGKNMHFCDGGSGLDNKVSNVRGRGGYAGIKHPICSLRAGVHSRGGLFYTLASLRGQPWSWPVLLSVQRPRCSYARNME